MPKSSMDKSTPDHCTDLEECLNICELRKEIVRHEKILDKLTLAIQSQADQLQHLSVAFRNQGCTHVWVPPQGMKVDICQTRSSDSIRKIETHQATSRDIISGLRHTWLGQFYIKNIKQHPFARQVVMWAWRNGYPIYVNHVASYFYRKDARKWRPLVAMSEFIKRNNVTPYKLADATSIEIAQPKVFPHDDERCLTISHERDRFPEIFVACIGNATVYGGTNLILTEDEVICHDLYDFERDGTSEELHGRTLIYPGSRRIRWLLHDESPEPIAVAATFVDACAGNYAHWLTEVLPRIALFCAEECFQAVPIIVNDGLHKNIMESLFLVAGVGREIIILPVGRALVIDKLYLTSATGYVPFGQRTKKLVDHSHGLFSPYALEMLRNIFIPIQAEENVEFWPENIFLRRSSGTRKIVNSSEIEKLLVTQGYVIVEPEKLTFLQQIKLFKNARIIISPTGAGLSNAIFCKSGTQVAVLMSKHENMIYRYWCNMLTPIQVKVAYVLGNITENKDLGIHGDFLVEIEHVAELLKEFGKI